MLTNHLSRVRLILSVCAALGVASPVLGQHGHTPAVSGAPQGIPLFCANPTISSIRSGAWSNPATWSSGRVPGSRDKVAIGAGHEVTYDVASDARLTCIDVRGGLTFSATATTRMNVGDLMVFEEGHLEVGSAARPVPATVTAEIIIADQPIDPVLDPGQLGTGIIALGRVTMHGAVKTPTFARLTHEPLVGETSLVFEQALEGWQAGDQVVLPDTRQLRSGERGVNYKPQDEKVRISAVAGSRVTLAAPLLYDHRGARTADGSVALLPHAGNVTRNVIVRSENPAGTRGHTFFISHADIDLRYAEFRELGRTRQGVLDNTEFDPAGTPLRIGTNQIGRYAIHFHHNFGPTHTPANGYQFTLIGNSIVTAPKWGVTVHNSHYGLVQNNVVYNTRGAGIVTEDGTESFNLFDHNFALRSEGSGEFAPRSGYGGVAPDPGGEGAGFWFRGQNNYIRNNVSANGDAFGFGMAAGALGTVRIPKFKGADTSLVRESLPYDTTDAPILEFLNNEAYGTMQAGMVCGWSGDIRNFTVWHASRHGLSGTPTDRLTVDTIRVYGDPSVLGDQIERPMGLWFTNYMSKSVLVRNVDIQGMRIGISSPFFGGSQEEPGRGDGSLTVENGRFTTQIGVVVATAYASDRKDGKPAKSAVVRNLSFTPLTVPGVVGPEAISMNYGMSASDSRPRDPITVYDFGRPGDNFRLYYSQDAPPSVAPCHETRPGVGGWVCR